MTKAEIIQELEILKGESYDGRTVNALQEAIELVEEVPDGGWDKYVDEVYDRGYKNGYDDAYAEMDNSEAINTL